MNLSGILKWKFYSVACLGIGLVKQLSNQIKLCGGFWHRVPGWMPFRMSSGISILVPLVFGITVFKNQWPWCRTLI